MRIAGFLFLPSGWLIVLFAIGLLSNTAQIAFVTAGIVLELLGLALVLRSHILPHKGIR
jgi:hypothetical protein